MTASAELWYEHDLLRGKLALLEEWLPCLPDALHTVRRMAWSLASCLANHLEREEALLFDLWTESRELSAASIQALLRDHRQYGARLTLLLELLSTTDGSPELAPVHAQPLIKELREHMAKEEQRLFPALDEPLGAHAVHYIDSEESRRM